MEEAAAEVGEKEASCVLAAEQPVAASPYPHLPTRGGRRYGDPPLLAVYPGTKPSDRKSLQFFHGYSFFSLVRLRHRRPPGRLALPSAGKR